MSSKTLNITSAQIRAARALLGWSGQQLADASLVSLATIRRIETRLPDQPGTRALTMIGIQRALEDAGVEFIEANGGGPGVRLKENPSTTTTGS